MQTPEEPSSPKFEHDPEAPKRLEEVLKKHAISLSPSKTRRLAQYCELLWFWNEKLNLTRHTDFEKFVARDLVDSLAMAEFLLEGERILDVGTGGGVPGVVLAIVRPDLQVELCDSTGKKAKAVGEIVKSLRLDIPVWNEKAEALFPTRRYSSLVVRAVSKLPKLLQLFAPHWHSFERILLLKGPNWVAERGESRHIGLMNNLALRVLKSYAIPGEETTNESVVLQICQKSKFETLSTEIETMLKNRVFTRGQKKEFRPRKKKYPKKKPFSR